MAKDVPGLNGALGEGEGAWPRVGDAAPAQVDVPEWPLVDTTDHGPNEGGWVKL